MTQEVTEAALRSPGVYAASAYAGVDATSGVTQSSSGQIYLVLDPFEKRLPLGLTADKVAGGPAPGDGQAPRGRRQDHPARRRCAASATLAASR